MWWDGRSGSSHWRRGGLAKNGAGRGGDDNNKDGENKDGGNNGGRGGGRGGGTRGGKGKGGIWGDKDVDSKPTVKPTGNYNWKQQFPVFGKQKNLCKDSSIAHCYCANDKDTGSFLH